MAAFSISQHPSLIPLESLQSRRNSTEMLGFLGSKLVGSHRRSEEGWGHPGTCQDYRGFTILQAAEGGPSATDTPKTEGRACFRCNCTTSRRICRAALVGHRPWASGDGDWRWPPFREGLPLLLMRGDMAGVGIRCATALALLQLHTFLGRSFLRGAPRRGPRVRDVHDIRGGLAGGWLANARAQSGLVLRPRALWATDFSGCRQSHSMGPSIDRRRLAHQGHDSGYADGFSCPLGTP